MSGQIMMLSQRQHGKLARPAENGQQRTVTYKIKIWKFISKTNSTKGNTTASLLLAVISLILPLLQALPFSIVTVYEPE